MHHFIEVGVYQPPARADTADHRPEAVDHEADAGGKLVRVESHFGNVSAGSGLHQRRDPCASLMYATPSSAISTPRWVITPSENLILVNHTFPVVVRPSRCTTTSSHTLPTGAGGSDAPGIGSRDGPTVVCAAI
jgi:hypothetical protein